MGRRDSLLRFTHARNLVADCAQAETTVGRRDSLAPLTSGLTHTPVYTTQKLKFSFSAQMIAESKPVKTDKPYRDMVRKSWLVLADEGWVEKPNFSF